MNCKIIISSLLSLSTFACSELPKSTQAVQTIERFQVQNDIVTDTKSGLMWTRCLIGAKWDGKTCEGKAIGYEWKKAQEVVKSSNYGGYSDWRIPTLAELKTLVDSESGEGLDKIPHVNQTVFPTPYCKGANRSATDHDGHSCWQWTTTPVENYSYHGWLVYFEYAYNTGIYEADNFALRLVRNN
jgi:hypothetical protein